MRHATYFEAVDIAQLMREFPVGDAFTARFRGMAALDLRAHQEALFAQQLQRAWQIPFYQRLWGGAGLTPADVRGLADIGRLPAFGKQEIMDSLARCPPLGDHHGRDIPVDGLIQPMILHTTSGTTGRPQPLLFSPRTREVHNLILARAYLLQGLKPTDVMHSVYGHGPVNGGHYIREAVLHYTPATLVCGGTGVETPSVKQVELMRDLGATVIAGFADYIRRLADVAREQGLVPGRDIPVRMITGHLAKDARESLSEAWGGVELYDWYGVGDTGLIATEGPDHDGMHLMEDAHWVEICDVDSGEPVPHGEAGDMVVTCLFSRDIFPIIRFNTHDVTRCLTTPSRLELPFRRIEGFLGRSDNMVKLRGINVFPQAMSSILAGTPGFAGEYLCVLTRDASGREDLTVRIEIGGERGEPQRLACADLLKRRLGVEVGVALVAPQALAALTGVESRQKPIRLLDQRTT
jgi:phenylacetate-CoA ligase